MVLFEDGVPINKYCHSIIWKTKNVKL